ncbi:MAG TPA: thioredoxin domain-containing protein [Candidatus Binataceae bacterium]|nr:thioredoxin domain-containing protein [Candidatus Binataceae bacterium]
MKLKIFSVGAALSALTILVANPSLHNISYANLTPRLTLAAEALAGDSPSDAKLKAALQKRLLVADPTLLELGPPSAGPLAGMSQRKVTISNGQGQKVELKYFTTSDADKGLLVHEFAAFDIADPWQHASVKSLHLEDRATLGPASAPITIIEFADFECPYCARAFSEIETVVNTTYKGKVRLIWKNFPLPSHDWAEQAAIAAECARQQNPAAFWAFAGSFYQDQTEINVQNLREHIERYANANSLDVKALNACVLTDAAEAKVLQDRKDGEGIQINSTPTFLVNGVEVVGLPTSNVFDFVITSQLAEKSASR